MPRISFDMAEDIHPATELALRGEALLRQDLLRDVHRGLADVEAGRVVSQEDARARLLARYS